MNSFCVFGFKEETYRFGLSAVDESNAFTQNKNKEESYRLCMLKFMVVFYHMINPSWALILDHFIKYQKDFQVPEGDVRRLVVVIVMFYLFFIHISIYL